MAIGKRDTPATGAEANSAATKPSYEAVVARLEGGGWLRSVMRSKRGVDDAGNERDDFDAAVKAVIAAYATPKMGIVVSGEYGCGKTAFIKAATKMTSYPYLFDMNVPTNRDMLRPDGGYGDVYVDLFSHSVVIDDLGAELRKRFGEPDFSEARDFICEYYTRGRGRLSITTNLRMSELLDRYGGRFVDRLKEMCVPVRFYGGSKRRWVKT